MGRTIRVRMDEKVIKRRRRVRRLLRKGLYPSEIAKELGIDKVTAYCDVRWVKYEENRIAKNKFPIRQQIKFLAQMEDQLRDAKEQLWGIYDGLKKEDVSSRIRILENIESVMDKELRVIDILTTLIAKKEQGSKKEKNPQTDTVDIKKVLDTAAKVIEKFVPEKYKEKAIDLMINLK